MRVPIFKGLTTYTMEDTTPVADETIVAATEATPEVAVTAEETKEEATSTEAAA